MVQKEKKFQKSLFSDISQVEKNSKNLEIGNFEVYLN